jgi:hypothetical protein
MSAISPYKIIKSLQILQDNHSAFSEKIELARCDISGGSSYVKNFVYVCRNFNRKIGKLRLYLQLKLLFETTQKLRLGYEENQRIAIGVTPCCCGASYGGLRR